VEHRDARRQDAAVQAAVISGLVYLPTTRAKEFSILLRRVITIDPTTLTQSRFAGRAVHLGCDCITQRTVE